jgi:Family of unknown function (DUF5675)
MIFVVQRKVISSVCTMGTLSIDWKQNCYTLEPPYAADTVKPRAIPAGTYDLAIGYSPHFNRLMPQVQNVPGFEGILIHWGNYPDDTEGCTIVGTLEEANFVGHSVIAFDELFKVIQDAVASGPQVITYLDPPKGA